MAKKIAKKGTKCAKKSTVARKHGSNRNVNRLATLTTNITTGKEKANVKNRALSVLKADPKLVELTSADATHKAIGGKYKHFLVKGLGTVGVEMKIVLLANARGREYHSDRFPKFVEESCLQNLTSNDMLVFAEDVMDEGEKEDLLQHEKKTWPCSKCGAAVTNDHGYCPIIVNGTQWLGTPATCIVSKGWGGCFAILNKLSEQASKRQCTTCCNFNDKDSTECASCESKQTMNATASVWNTISLTFGVVTVPN